MAILKQSTAYNRMILMVDSSDHVTGKTGLTVTVTLSKNGAAFGSLGGSVTEVSSGWYKVALNTTDTGTLGDLAFHCTSTGADPTDFVDQVSARLIDDLAVAGDAMALTSGERNSTADAILGRNVSGGSSTGRTVKQALHFLRNKWAISSGTLTVYDTDDTTSSWTATVGTDGSAVPVVSNDPA